MAPTWHQTITWVQTVRKTTSVSVSCLSVSVTVTVRHQMDFIGPNISVVTSFYNHHRSYIHYYAAVRQNTYTDINEDFKNHSLK